jgi:hypothetical protein
VYNMETTEIVSLYQVPIINEAYIVLEIIWHFACVELNNIIFPQNSSEELYSLFEIFYDHFHANPQNSLHGNFISSHSNSVHALDQLRTTKNKASSTSQVILWPSEYDPLFISCSTRCENKKIHNVINP